MLNRYSIISGLIVAMIAPALCEASIVLSGATFATAGQPVTLAEGEQEVWKIFLDGTLDVNTDDILGFDLRYTVTDPAVVSVTSAVNPALFSAQMGNGNFSGLATVDIPGGQVIELGTFTFTGLSAGTASIVWDNSATYLVALDSEFNNFITYVNTPAEVTAVPEPSSFVYAIGLLISVGFRRAIVRLPPQV